MWVVVAQQSIAEQIYISTARAVFWRRVSDKVVSVNFNRLN
jgi:hypothetical protein